MDNQSISQLHQKRKKAQEDYIRRLAAERGLTTEQLEVRLIHDICRGVPGEETANILTNMFHACQRVNGNGGTNHGTP